MNELVEVVKTELQNAYRSGRAKASGKDVSEIVMPNEFVFDTFAHVAIKATLEHVYDYASSEMISKGYAAMQRGIGPGIAVEVLRAMLSQALSEIED